ncbi:secretory pathway Sec39 [Eremomyces bilateralis CBS 781.70]|uniref:Secretory pathway Sec39 n=1 Tax=Eremomyces bilateralis CBS 781.70 TaxID=1392243 RepID=A0A6G1GEH2_9PEZI|nr:secretory pathway Sec39 [Eremomyces bilateralis CBS 781.70]KAF1816424.1 secretory pathway Sec39 [Eremomyces bilateralis CBS 781.70]
MVHLTQLSRSHCFLLAAQYASEANISAFSSLRASRPECFDAELLLRILLTFLSEGTEPGRYTPLARDIAHLRPSEEPTVEVDISAVDEISDGVAKKRAKRLVLVPVRHPSRSEDDTLDTFTHFLIHRAYQLDQAGLLRLTPCLITPYLDHSSYLRTWYTSIVLPLVRVNLEFYPDVDPTWTVPVIETLFGREGVDALLAKGQTDHNEDERDGKVAARDIKALVGPWVYGSNERKRRRVGPKTETRSESERRPSLIQQSVDPYEGLSGIEADWNRVFDWLQETAVKDPSYVVDSIDDWSGPNNVDLGESGGYGALTQEQADALDVQYVRSMVAVIYGLQNDASASGIAQRLLRRIETLGGFEPSAALDPNAKLPRVAPDSPIVQDIVRTLNSNSNLRNTALSEPTPDAISLLQACVLSSSMLGAMGHDVSVANAAKIKSRGNIQEQLAVLEKILHSRLSIRLAEPEWISIREKVLWLWSWNPEDVKGVQHSNGVLGAIDRAMLEKHVLKTFLTAGCYQSAIRTYLQENDSPLERGDVEATVLAAIFTSYDNASNGNKTRGGMKKATEILAIFRPQFRFSEGLKRCDALISATHALSFYSLTLQHAVPFQPVSIRVSGDPLALLGKVFSQNPKSYTKLDDLISIAKNFVGAGLPSDSPDEEHRSRPVPDLETKQFAAEMRVTGMAIEAALAEDDFETAYSYVVNRLNPQQEVDRPSTPSTARARKSPADDIAWRAALLAGKFRPSDPSTFAIHASAATSTPPSLRRLEQRMELLSQALLLAPPSALAEVLAVWRRCEEEMTTLLAQEAEAESSFNDRADRRIPGGFDTSAAFVQPRREVGRGAVEEAPMGLFDVARGAAAAFSKTAFPLRGGANSSAAGEKGQVYGHEREGSGASGSDGEGTVRKRDMVANAVAGGLASGLGWVLGTTPVQNQPK